MERGSGGAGPGLAGVFGVGEFFVAAVVAAGFDQLAGCGEVGVGAGAPGVRLAGSEEAGAVEEDVGHEKAHGSTGSDLPACLQVGVGTGGAPCNYIARWNGSAWQPLGTGTSSDLFPFVRALTGT